MKTKIKLGQEVQDTISGMKGICVCLADWLYGCFRIGIQPQGLDKDGKAQETAFFDEAGVMVVGLGVCKDTEQSKPKKKYTGGPNREQPGKERY